MVNDRQFQSNTLCHYRFGMLSEVKLGARFPGLVLSPTGVATLSPRDTPFVEANGLGVVDCSWKEVERTPLHKVCPNQPIHKVQMCDYSPSSNM